MVSLAYFADLGGANKVYFLVDPVPIPLPIFAFVNTKEALLPTKVGADIVSGGYDIFLGGSHATSRTMTVNVALMTRASYDDIITKASRCELFVFSPDAVTEHKCCFDPGTGEPSYIEGSEYIQWGIKL